MISFYQLPDVDNQKEIAMKGYLLKDEGLFYFCSDMDSCYSRGKNRLQLIINDKDQEYFNDINHCHVALVGKFRGLEESQTHWPFMGYFEVLRISGFDFSPDYHLINKNCIAYNIRE
ncbi:hypothetical protein CWI83_06690 [Pseudidiomarina taiwanensis]|uniref:Uncharacterized protein n=2 Tax=Pseudidiomarina taiwanensis TaxID=337250 RepID=A0A432ZL40_9GAMM|nr:hypothetical protein CWI83_06690 [Pseudidiomarina taiwanensis]